MSDDNKHKWDAIENIGTMLAFVLLMLVLCPHGCSGAEVEPCHPQEVEARTGIQALAVSAAQAAARDGGVAKLCREHEYRWASRLGYHLANAGLCMVIDEAQRLGYAHLAEFDAMEDANGGTSSAVFVGGVGAPLHMSVRARPHASGGRADKPDGVVVEVFVRRSDGVDVPLARETVLADGVHDEH